jgi:hypothetical protein
MNPIAEIYSRIPGALRGMPYAVAIPVIAELAQHAAEIQLGMYGAGGLATAAVAPLRMLFGLIKILCLLLFLLFAVRWWAFEGNVRRAVSPGILFFKGVGLFMLIEFGGESLMSLMGKHLALLAGPTMPEPARIAITVLPILLWWFAITLLLPWFIGMIVEDKNMNPRRSVTAIGRRILSTFGLLLAGVLPAMILHYAISYVAMGRAPALVWALLVLDVVVVGLLALSLASTYFTIYRRAADRSLGGRSGEEGFV